MTNENIFITDDKFIEVTNTCGSMALASKLLGLSYKNFRKKAIVLNCFNPNQRGKGLIKPRINGRINLNDILNGLYPSYQTYKLKIRLIDEGIFKDECSICGWNKKPDNSLYTTCELDHINGVPYDHKKENLRIICPNCHSLTKTYRFRRGKTNIYE